MCHQVQGFYGVLIFKEVFQEVEYLQLLELLCLFLLWSAGIIVFHVRRILQMSTCV